MSPEWWFWFDGFVLRDGRPRFRLLRLLISWIRFRTLARRLDAWRRRLLRRVAGRP